MFPGAPSPPTLTACVECGNYSIESGQSIEVKAPTIFESVSGHIMVVVRDMGGDEREFKLTVSPSEESRTIPVLRDKIRTSPIAGEPDGRETIVSEYC